VQVLDAISGIRSWDETLAMLEQGKPTNDIKTDSAGWAWHEELGVWAGPEDARLSHGQRT
jgi:hypothetical protein